MPQMHVVAAPPVSQGASYEERREIFKSIWNSSETKNISKIKPKIIKTLRVSSDSIKKNKIRRIRNLKLVCNKILNYCDRIETGGILTGKMTRSARKRLKSVNTRKRKRKFSLKQKRAGTKRRNAKIGEKDSSNESYPVTEGNKQTSSDVSSAKSKEPTPGGSNLKPTKPSMGSTLKTTPPSVGTKLKTTPKLAGSKLKTTPEPAGSKLKITPKLAGSKMKTTPKLAETTSATARPKSASAGPKSASAGPKLRTPSFPEYKLEKIIEKKDDKMRSVVSAPPKSRMSKLPKLPSVPDSIPEQPLHSSCTELYRLNVSLQTISR